MQKWRFLLILSVLSVVFAFLAYANEECAGYAEYDGYIMQFKNDEAKNAALDYINKCGFLLGDEEPFSEIYAPENWYKTNDESLAKMLDQMGFLDYYEPNALAYLFDYDYTKETYYSSQMNWAHGCSNVMDAWEYGVYGNNVKVAVIDSGVLGTHEDLIGRVSDGFTLVTGSPATSPKIGHGTGVAGIIGAAANGKGVLGVAHRVEIIPIKVTDEGSFSASLLSLAVEMAISLDVDVINLSLGTNADNINFRNAINNAINKGIIVIAASGNTSSYPQGTLVYPGAYDNVISVGNLMKNGTSYQISSTSIANNQVTICAPGTSVISTNSTLATSYSSWSGTSFACPYVAGIAALAKSVDPDITQSEFMELLTATADKSVLGGATRLDTYGYGIADAGALIEKLIDIRHNGGFISPIDKTASGEINVKIHNPLETQQTLTFVAKIHSAGRPISFATKPVTLEPGEVVEIPLASFPGSNTSDISFYLLDNKFRPLYKKIDD